MLLFELSSHSLEDKEEEEEESSSSLPSLSLLCQLSVRSHELLSLLSLLLCQLSVRSHELLSLLSLPSSLLLPLSEEE